MLAAPGPNEGCAMPRDSLGRYTERRPRLVGAGRRLRFVGVEYGPEVNGVRSGSPVAISPRPAPEPEPAPKATRSSRSDS